MTRARILVAEDEALIAEELRERLERMGHEVVAVVAYAEDAIARAAAEAPDLVLMDIRLRGERDGIEAAAVVRDRSDVPVVYLTAHSDDATIRRARETAPFGYLLKPLDDRDLRVTIQMVLHRHRAERRLRESQARLVTTLTSIGDAVIATDEDGRVTFLNPVAESLTRWSQAEAEGQPIENIFRLVHAITRTPEPNPIARALRENRIVTMGEHAVLVARDGTEVPVDDSAAPVRERGGRVLGGVMVVRDISERGRAAAALRQADEQLREAQKMEAIGRLAGGVAHDINNMMTVVTGAADLLLEDAGQSDSRRHIVEQIRHAARRSAAVTRQLLAFGRKQILQPVAVNLNRQIAGLKDDTLRDVIGQNVRLDITADDAIGPVLLDPGQFGQVLLNLVINARDAMPDGGTISIATSHALLDDEDVRMMPELAPGRYVMLTVADQGLGMDAVTRARAFEPFFTTKGVGQGTGLGLATVYGIVKQSGGHISVHSEVGAGSVFRLYFPVTAVETVPEAAGGSIAATPRKESILLVEDDDTVRGLVASVLRRSGYGVIEAGDGPEALRFCQADSRHIDLLLTDAVMPSMSGRELVESIAAIRPGVKVLFMSGHTDDQILRLGVVRRQHAFIAKPFTVKELGQKIRDVLDG